MYVSNPSPITTDDQEIKRTKSFTSLGSVIKSDGEINSNIQNRLNKAKGTFNRRKDLGKLAQYNMKTKMRIYNLCPVNLAYKAQGLAYDGGRSLKGLSIFHTICLRVIFRIFWPRTISKNELLDIKDMKTKLKNDDGDVSGIYFGEKPTALRKWPSTGHQRESGERPT